MREAIDVVDTELLSLLNRRMELVVEVGRLKRARGLPLFCPGREEEIFDRLGKANTGPLPQESLHSIYREVLAASRLIQETRHADSTGEPKARAAYPAPNDPRGKCATIKADNGPCPSRGTGEPT